MSVLEPESYSVPRRDLVALVCGLLVFIASFLPWYGVSLAGPAESGATGTYNAWHGIAGVGLILLLFSLVVTAAEPYVSEGAAPRALKLAAAVLAVVGAALVVIRSFDLPSVDIPGATVGLRWGGWVLIVLVVVQAVVSVMRVVRAGVDDPSSA